jgi:hypothetical protein
MPTVRAVIASVTAALAAVLTAAPLPAQIGTTKGLFVGAQFSGVSADLKAAYGELDFSGGYGLHAGLGLGNTWSVLVNYDRSTLAGTGTASVKLVQYDALLRAHVLAGANSPVRPFLTAGATGRGTEGATDFDGVSPTAGAGVQIRVVPRVALTGTALWTFGNLTSTAQLTGGVAPQSFKSTSTRLQVGASVYLFGH